MSRDDDAGQPWGRQSGESARAFDAFTTYAHLGPAGRSLRRVAQELGKSASLMSRWSAQHEWVERASAFDLAATRDAERAVAAARRTLAARHVRTAGKALARVEAMIDALPEEAPPVADVVKLWTAAAEIERAALSIPTRVEVTGAHGGPVKVAGWTDEERLSRLIALNAELTSRIDERRSALRDEHVEAPHGRPGPDPQNDPEAAPESDIDDGPDWWLTTDNDEHKEHP